MQKEERLKRFEESSRNPNAVYVLKEAVEYGLTEEELDYLENPLWTPQIMKWILEGLRSGMTLEQVKIYTEIRNEKPVYNAAQMGQYVAGFQSGIEWEELKQLLQPELNARTMGELIKNYLELQKTKQDVYLEMQDYYFVRVPYSRDNAYMKVSKDRMWLFHDRYHTFLEKNQMVHLYRKDGQEIRSEPFDEFYQDHYDPVAVTILREDYYKTENAAYDGMGKERLPMKKDDIEEARTKKRKGKQKGSEKTKISADKKGQYTDKSTIRFSMDRVLLMEKESTKEEMIFRVPNSSARYYISVSPDELAKTENLTFDDGKKKERITYFMQRREDELLTVHDTKTGKEFQISAKELYNTYYHYDSKWKGKKEPEPARKQKRNTGLSQNKTDASGAGKGKSKPSESKASKPKVKGVKR